MSLTCQKEHFNIDPQITYLNCAAYGPFPTATARAGQEAVLLKSQPQSIVPQTHFFDLPDTARALTAQLLHCKENARIAMLPSVSYGMAIVARNLQRLPHIDKKKNIIIIGEEFPNNYYTFLEAAKENNLELITIELSQDGYDMEKLYHAITSDTALVVTPHVHWIYGYRFDIAQVSQRCKQVGSLYVIDGTQSVGVLDFDVNIVQPDALICAYYKWLLGPYGSAFGYFGPFFDDGEPIEYSWTNRIESNQFAGLLRYLEPYRPMAQRYNVGESAQFIHLPMIIESLRQILFWGVKNIYEYNIEMIRSAVKKLDRFEIVMDIDNIGHLFSIKVPLDVDPNKITQILNEHQIIISNRGSAIRVAPHLYNDHDDVNQLISVLNGL